MTATGSRPHVRRLGVMAALVGSILRWSGTSPSDASPADAIGAYMRSDAKLVAKASSFVVGFVNVVWWPVVGAVVGLLCCIRVLDRRSAGLPLSLTCMTLNIPGVMLSNSALLTALPSRGLVAAPLLPWLAPRSDKSPDGIADPPQRLPVLLNRRRLPATGSPA